MRPEVEILAPAGSWDCLIAAINAGADAVYVGGSRFGARAFADNFTQERLLEAIDYVHLHGRKLYLTVNTLLKEQELNDELYQYLLPYYERGLDAVIVQDLGVLTYVRRYFPDLPIHASTQMTITDESFARLMESYQVERVVTSRELSFEEVRRIADNTNLEIESFVHGALCYCYSGQCLFSSLIGGRSGNRGQCAQPCRLPYRVNGSKRPEYVLSLKDMCTLDEIPSLVEAGIYSFKIEGRMKKPEYVALVTYMYRKYADLYLKNGKAGYQVEAKDKLALMDLYNRGGFCSGYYKMHNGREMVSIDRPNHAGVVALRVTKKEGRYVTATALTDIYPGDVIELPGKDTYTIAQGCKKNQVLRLQLSKKCDITNGAVLSRTRNESLITRIKDEIIDKKRREKIFGKVTLKAGEASRFVVTDGEHTVEVTGNIIEAAKNQPTDAERIRKQLAKTGNTEFAFERLEVEMTQDLFVPMQELNELRREALAQLESEILSSYRRVADVFLQTDIEKKMDDNAKHLPRIYAYAERMEQVRVLICEGAVSRIYMDANAVPCIWEQNASEICRAARENHKELYLAMPHIFRADTRRRYEEGYQTLFSQSFDGVLVRNMESYMFLQDMGYEGDIVLDHHMYQFNNQSKEFWNARGIHSFTAPIELNFRELAKLGVEEDELVVYGYLPMMVSAQCVVKTTKGCKKKPEELTITDRYHMDFRVCNRCDYCYNVIYNTAPLSLIDQKAEIEGLSVKALRLSFTKESGDMVHKLVREFEDVYLKGEPCKEPDYEFTRGHFKRGVN